MIGSSAHNRVMSLDQRDEVEEWLRDAARLVLLADWWIVVEHEPPSEDADAEISAVDGHMHARVRVSATLLTEAPDYVVETLLHELLHLHTADVEHYGETHLNEDQTVPFRRSVERLVDQLARVLREWVELPPIEPVLKAPRLTTG